MFTRPKNTHIKTVDYFLRCGLAIFAACMLTACDARHEEREGMEARCRYKICEGDVFPAYDHNREVVFKRNGDWFVAPRVYGDPNFGALAFYWPSKRPLRDWKEPAPELRPSSANTLSNYPDVAIELIFHPEHMFKGQEASWTSGSLDKETVVEGRHIRQGLEAVRILEEGRTSRATKYIATDLRGFDDLPPMLNCYLEDSRNGASALLRWRDGVRVGIRMANRHCGDWPEIYKEVANVLNKVERR
ncbi:hypothetical protein QTH97_26260 [Variovorax sp. J22R24]|uniref:hypothetical protein n=1 Tax=Variovorax gracilis TaxID=3053502 RepID=UPI002578182F|nr:hypothetical protein [Variovorax sp. J22R24]MDM0108480.1 hypothetical protein [Variovorax sp. J22R24]